MNLILAGLSAIDIGVIVLGIFPMTLPGLNTYYQSLQLNTVISYCVAIMYPLGMSAKTSSVWLLCVITFERYIAVCYPFRVRTPFYDYQRSLKILVTVICSAVLYNFVRFWEFKIVDGLDGDFKSLKLNLRQDRFYYTGYYTCLYIVTHFLVPFASLVAMNLLIAKAIRQARCNRDRMSRQKQGQHKTAQMMCLIIGIFILTNTIPYILNIIEALNPDLMANAELSAIPFLIMDISNTLIVLNCSATIFVYYCYSSKFRTALKTRNWLGVSRGSNAIDICSDTNARLSGFHSIRAQNNRTPLVTLKKFVKSSRTVPLAKSSSKYEAIDYVTVRYASGVDSVAL